MNTNSLFSYRDKLVQSITTTFSDLSNEGIIHPEYISDLLSLTVKGKLIRGSLASWIYDAYTQSVDDKGISLGAVLEIFQTMFLIHDDILDRDTFRRGQKTLHEKYREVGITQEAKDSQHFGESMALCLGDSMTFLGYMAVSSLPVSSDVKNQLIAFLSREYIRVVQGEMTDMMFASKNARPSQEEILAMYINKTARYTCVVPLVSGAMFAKAPRDDYALLEKLGEAVGVAFQIHDDYLGTFGSDGVTGKSTASDIRENKQTIYKSELLRVVSPDEYVLVEKIFGNVNSTQENIEYIHLLMEKYHIVQKISKVESEYARKATQLCASLSIDEAHKQELNQFIQFVITRNV